jgi:hypothetical protein
MTTDCFKCKNKRPIPGDAHIKCAKPDPLMTGHRAGIQSGWFRYPENFDSIWRTKECDNFEPVDV